MSHPERSSPGAIFFEILARIERRLKKAGRARAFKDPDESNALRGELFALEGWAKLHRHWPKTGTRKKEHHVFVQIREQSKRIEDALGALDLAREFQSVLREKDQPDLVRLYEVQERKARQSLKHLLKNDHWFQEEGETRVESMRKHLLGIEWPPASEQIEFMLRALVNDLTALAVRYRDELKPKLKKTIYDDEILERDLHKFRRQLRWFSMHFQTADGLIRLGPVPSKLTVEKRKLVSTYRDHPFAVLSTKKLARAQIDPIAFYEITRLVEHLGETKDKSERYFHVRERLIASGEPAHRATERVNKIFGDVPREAPLETHVIMAEYERLKPLTALAKSLAGS